MLALMQLTVKAMSIFRILEIACFETLHASHNKLSVNLITTQRDALPSRNQRYKSEQATPSSCSSSWSDQCFLPRATAVQMLDIAKDPWNLQEVLLSRCKPAKLQLTVCQTVYSDDCCCSDLTVHHRQNAAGDSTRGCRTAADATAATTPHWEVQQAPAYNGAAVAGSSEVQSVMIAMQAAW